MQTAMFAPHPPDLRYTFDFQLRPIMQKSLVVVVLLFAAGGATFAADWPQWRGPNRDGISQEKGLLQAWPEKGPNLLWKFEDAGLGFSSFAVVGDRLYTMGARKDETYVIALDAAKGKEVWSTKIGPIFSFNGNQWGDGPRSAPTVDGDAVYALDGNGLLVCLQTSDGKERWRVDFVKELGGEMMSDWGFSESVLVDGDNVICTPGGKGGLLAALDKKTGKVKWRSKDAVLKAPYSSTVVAKIGGVRQYVQAGYVDPIQGGVISGFADADGKQLWAGSLFKGARDYIAPTPIVQENLVYMTCGDSSGCHLFDVKGDMAKDLYSKKNSKTVSNDHGGMVLVDGHIYGHAGTRGWVCQDFKTGDIKWFERFELPGKSGAITYADGCLYLFDEDGVAALLKVNSEKFEPVGKFELGARSKLASGRQSSVSSKNWTHPVIANGKLYLREQEFIFCYDVKAK